jgi:hypothetical protein
MDLFQNAGAGAEPQAQASAEARLTRQQTVERILEINPTATSTFLERFDDRPLKQYLDHLVAASSPRGASARWVRPGDSPAIVTRESAD